tara:strand:+ start:447 stop:866 length:420 start_codon:yes stop_codon:yes gene_type:complete
MLVVTMEIKDVQANTGNLDLVLIVTEKDEPRTFEKFGKTGRVCNTKVKDDTGEMKLTLWNEDVDKVKVGDKIHLKNGWCSEFRDEKQLSSGKFGEIEVIEPGSGDAVNLTPASELAEPKESTTQSVPESEIIEEEELIE